MASLEAYNGAGKIHTMGRNLPVKFTSPITRIQINQSLIIEQKGIYSNISEKNKNKQYIVYVLPLI
jgi:hypothetical protein